MKSLPAALFCLIVAICTHAQSFAPDARLKADILAVVAHPDDESLIGSYLARAVLDQHKNVAVVYCTSEDSGANSERE